MTEYRDDLVPGQSVVRVIDDEEKFEHLCEMSMGSLFTKDKSELCGKVMTIEKLLPSRSGYKIGGWSIPYSACILVKL